MIAAGPRPQAVVFINNACGNPNKKYRPNVLLESSRFDSRDVSLTELLITENSIRELEKMAKKWQRNG
jgi:hypothetical protein